MSKAPYDPNYPDEIDLGRPVPKDSISPMGGSVAGGEKPKKGKTVISYPDTYISGGADLAKIPESGYALIEFKRTDVGLRTPRDGKGEKEGHVTLEIHSICLPKGGGGDMASDFAQFAKKAGVDTGDGASTPAPAEEDESDTDAEET